MTEILLDYFLPAADQSNPAHAMSRRSVADLESSNTMAMTSRVKRSEDGAAEPEPEGEPEPSDDYYCVKKSLGGNTLKSCLPKVILDKRPTTTSVVCSISCQRLSWESPNVDRL